MHFYSGADTNAPVRQFPEVSSFIGVLLKAGVAISMDGRIGACSNKRRPPKLKSDELGTPVNEVAIRLNLSDNRQRLV
jgi:hypothetical protein